MRLSYVSRKINQAPLIFDPALKQALLASHGASESFYIKRLQREEIKNVPCVFISSFLHSIHQGIAHLLQTHQQRRFRETLRSKKEKKIKKFYNVKKRI